MIIGIPPFYIFPGSIEKWGADTTYYAANMGASLITQALIRQLSAEYVDITQINIDDSNVISEYRNKFDVCVLALATHIHPNRDVSLYASFLETLQIKTIVLSAGISDYDQGVLGNYQIHSSMKRILDLASETSEWIGVRGHYTASVLRRHGYKNVVPIGCPSLFWSLEGAIHIEKMQMNNPLVAFHRLLAIKHSDKIRDLPLLGQDWQDQPLFTKTLENETELLKYIDEIYGENGEAIRAAVYGMIKNNGKFFFDFSEWFDYIGRHDFIIGGRLHGTIAGLIQNIPAVLVIRDLRTKEMAEFFDIPAIELSDLKDTSIRDVFERIDYSKFHLAYSLRRSNYIHFLNENGLVHNFKDKSQVDEFRFSFNDLTANLNLVCSQNAHVFGEVYKLRQDLSNNVLPEISNLKHDLLEMNIVLRIIRKLRKIFRR